MQYAGVANTITGGQVLAMSSEHPSSSGPTGTGSAVLPGEGFDLTQSGEFWMLCAAQSMAVGTVMVRYVTRHADSIYATGYHMLIGGLMLMGAVAVQEPGAVQASLLCRVG